MLSRLLQWSIGAVGRLPLPAAQVLGAGLGSVIWLLPNRARRTASANIARCFPALTPAAHRRLLRQSLQHLGRTVTDSAWVWTRPPAALESVVREVRGYDAVEAAQTAGRGVIFVSPHIGCWELVGTWLARRTPLTALYRPPRLRALEPIMIAGRERTGARLVPTDARGVRTLARALKAGEAIGILPDQAPPPGRGVIAPFFGEPARTMMLLSRLARQREVSVIFCVMERLPRGAGFRLHLLPAIEEVGAADDIAAATAVNREVERCIALRPEQYMWSYRRFRRVGSRRGGQKEARPR